MNCKCGRELTLREEKKFQKCMSCYNKEWSDKITERTKDNKETALIQANNTLNIYKELNKGQENKPCNYNDAIKSYEEYIKYLENL